MLKSSKLGDSVASEMDKILNSQDFQSVFEPDHIVASDYSGALSTDPGYKAFVRVASKKTCEEPKCDESGKEKGKGKKPAKDEGKEPAKEEKGKGKKGKLPPWLAKGKKDKKKEAAEALGYILNSLTQTSEVLDNLGLAKSATVTLALANGIMKEAVEMGDESWEYEDGNGSLYDSDGTDEYGIDGEGEAFEADSELASQIGERIPSELEVDEDPYIGSLDEEGWQPPIDLDRERFGSDVADAKDKKDKKEEKEEEDEDEDKEKDDEDEKEDEDDCGNYIKASKKNRKKVAQLNQNRYNFGWDAGQNITNADELQKLIDISKTRELTPEEKARFEELKKLIGLPGGNLPVGQTPATPLTSSNSKVTDPQILTLVADINNWLKK